MQDETKSDLVSEFYENPTPAGAVAVARADHIAFGGGHGIAEFVYQLHRAEAICKQQAELVAALRKIIALNGCTGGPKMLIAEYKHIAREALATVQS